MLFSRKMKNSKSINPLPFVYYYVPVVFLTIAGLIDSIYLSVSHFRVYTDIGYKSFCAVSRSFNCDTVSQSPYSIFLDIPVPVWGTIGYLFFLFVLIAAKRTDNPRKHFWGFLFLIALVFSVISLFLAYISIFLIRSYCIMCMVSFAVNFLLLFFTWLICKRFGPQGLFAWAKNDLNYFIARKNLVLFMLLAFSGMVTTGFMIPDYWEMDAQHTSVELKKGMTEDGHPWVGAEDPELTITEFTDYRCFQCKKMHYYLRALVRENEDRIRLVHKHFPMDHKFNPLVKKPYHVGSGTLALFSIYAQDQGKFWEANDIFFKLKKSINVINIKTIAEKLDLGPKALAYARYDRSIRYRLQKDIEKGLELGFTGTPSYVINDEIFQGHIPSRILKQYID